MVLLQPEGPEVPQRSAAEQGGGVGILEGDGDGQADLRGASGGEERAHRREEGPGVLPGEAAQGQEDQLDHARVPPRRRPPEQHLPPREVRRHLHAARRLGPLPDLQEAQPPADSAAIGGPGAGGAAPRPRQWRRRRRRLLVELSPEPRRAVARPAEILLRVGLPRGLRGGALPPVRQYARDGAAGGGVGSRGSAHGGGTSEHEPAHGRRRRRRLQGCFEAPTDGRVVLLLLLPRRRRRRRRDLEPVQLDEPEVLDEPADSAQFSPGIALNSKKTKRFIIVL